MSLRRLSHPIVLLVGVMVLGGIVVLPGLGSFGLWEPPDSWPTVIQRRTDGRTDVTTNRRDRFSRPRSELLYAEQARRALQGESSAETGSAARNRGKVSRGRGQGDPVAELPPRPPLRKWAMVASYRLFGVKERSARLPMALSALLVLGLTLLSLWWFFGPGPAVLGGVVLLGMSGFVLQARQVTSGMLNQACALMAVLGLGALVAPGRRRSRWWTVALWALPLALLGLVGGYLARGALVGLGLPFGSVLVAMLATTPLYRRAGQVGEAGVSGDGDAGGESNGGGESDVDREADVEREADAGGESADECGASGTVASRAVEVAGGDEAGGEDEAGDAFAAERPGRIWYWGWVGVLAGACIGLVAGAVWILSQQGTSPRYSAFLGETPRIAARVLNPHGMAKTNVSEVAVFDVLLKQVGFAGFPWVVLVPFALFFALWPRRLVGLGAVPAGALDAADGVERAARDRFGRALLASWVLVSLLGGTYYVLRIGDLHFPALAGLAGLVAVMLWDLASVRRRRLYLVGALFALAALAILVRDFGDFPELLVSSHLTYQIQMPAGISLKTPLRLFMILFAPALLLLLVAWGLGEEDAEDASVALPLPRGDLGLARRLGLPDAPGKAPCPAPVLAAIQVALLAAAGGGLAWVLQRRPQPAPVVLGAVLAPLLLPLLPMALGLFVDPVVHALRVLGWLLGRVALPDTRPGGLILTSRERDLLRADWGRYCTAPKATQVLLAVPGAGVAVLHGLRLAGRALLLVGLGLLLLPVTAFVGWRLRQGAARPVPGTRRVATTWFAVIPVGVSLWLAFSLVPRLSKHYSYKAIIDTYNRSRAANRDAPLLLWDVTTRSPRFYTAGPLLHKGEVQKRYPARSGASPLLQYLARGWRDARHGQQNRVYAVIPAGQLGRLDRDAHAHEPPISYFVLDNRNSFYLLLSNRLGKVRRGDAWVAERDQNPLRKVILEHPPKVACPGRRDIVCRRLQVALAEHKGATEASLELIGARYPRWIAPGSSFEVVLYFHVLRRIRGKYKVFIHVDGMGNRILGDHDPVGGRYDTTLWLPGRYVVDRYEVPASASSAVATPRGPYTLYVGLFQGQPRMQVLRGPNDKHNRVIVGGLRVGGGAGCCR